MLKAAGARGLMLVEEWDKDSEVEKCIVRFAWPVGENFESIQQVQLSVKPLPPEQGARSAWKVSPEQRERQAWRALAWYLKTMLEAATFGLLKFEDVFLSFFVTASGETIGEHIIPMLESGRLQLPKGQP
jgi:hypothetical protein